MYNYCVEVHRDQRAKRTEQNNYGRTQNIEQPYIYIY